MLDDIRQEIKNELLYEIQSEEKLGTVIKRYKNNKKDKFLDFLLVDPLKKNLKSILHIQ